VSATAYADARCLNLKRKRSFALIGQVQQFGSARKVADAALSMEFSLFLLKFAWQNRGGLDAIPQSVGKQITA